MVQWLRLCTSSAGAQVWSLVGTDLTYPVVRPPPPGQKRGRTVSLSLSPLPLQWEPLLVFPLVSCYCSLQMHPWVEPYHSVRSPPHRFISVSSFWFSPCNVSLFLWFPFFSFVKWTPATEYTCIYALLSAYLLVKTKQNKKNTFVSVN